MKRVMDLQTALEPAHPACNALGRQFWVFTNAWGEDFAEPHELGVVRSCFETDGIPFTVQWFPAPK